MDKRYFQTVVMKDALDKYPELTTNGLDALKNHYPFNSNRELGSFAAERKKEISNSQSQLQNSYLEFCVCVEYLRKLLSKEPQRYSSIALSTDIEDDVGCDVSEGIIIVAAFYLGLSIEADEEDCDNDYITVLPIRLVGAV